MKCPQCSFVETEAWAWELLTLPRRIRCPWCSFISDIADFPPTPPSPPRQVVVDLFKPQSTLPHRQHPSDAGYDLHANEAMTINVGATKLVRCGIRIAIPRGVVGFICPRSGLALKRGVTVLNGPGVIDPGFEDELGVVLVNLGDRNFEVAVGDRIAQIVFVETATVEVVLGAVGGGEVGAASTARRGGFGSSGGFSEALGRRGNEDRDKMGPSRQ
jgi:dUTP pyrophosphatase